MNMIKRMSVFMTVLLSCMTIVMASSGLADATTAGVSSNVNYDQPLMTHWLSIYDKPVKPIGWNPTQCDDVHRAWSSDEYRILRQHNYFVRPVYDKMKHKLVCKISHDVIVTAIGNHGKITKYYQEVQQDLRTVTT